MATLLRRVESRTTRSERIGAPRIHVAVTVLNNSANRPGHEHGASLGRRSAPGRPTGVQRTGRLVQRPGANARGRRRPPAHRRSSLDLGAAPVDLSGSGADTLRTRGEHRGLIDAPAARTIALSVPAAQVANRRLRVADVLPVRSDQRLGDADDTRAPAAPLDLERLTDKVVAAIDRRLWSHRERMGGR
ncbi:hypothetical protein ACFQW6_03660 [Nocardioides sp. GCM10028917]|uniref:hypothetical protein n=1 Tax=Nocardioides sp. GCM10028917 TaxID=3273408 RepID=UPI0036243CF1